ncbi:MAG: AI-2E family transporter [Candidatus Cryptobacteroides sp.]
MESRNNTELLAGAILKSATFVLICLICWYFRSTISYIILAAVLSFICRPIARAIGKIHIKGRKMPEWLTAIFTIITVLAILLGIITQVIPVVTNIIQGITANLQNVSTGGSVFSEWLRDVNSFLIDKFPALGYGFRIEQTFTDWLTKEFDISSITSMMGSVASALGNFGIGLFSVVFICFFFVKNDNLFKNIIGALVPDKMEEDAIVAVGEIEHLLSRYFVGLVCEVIGVALLNFLGLLAFGKIGFSASLGIAFIAGLLNVIPYVGPWIGCALGTSLGLVIRFSSAAAAGAHPSLLAAALTILAVFLATQMVDNFLFQPLIYSTSIKSSPLEVFIVLLIAGHIAGVVGMLVAIPGYTVVRVIASRFLRGFKPIRRLMEATGNE